MQEHRAGQGCTSRSACSGARAWRASQCRLPCCPGQGPAGWTRPAPSLLAQEKEEQGTETRHGRSAHRRCECLVAVRTNAMSVDLAHRRTPVSMSCLAK
eukprot:405718-Rhodomonas_salina.2